VNGRNQGYRFMSTANRDGDVIRIQAERIFAAQASNGMRDGLSGIPQTGGF